MTSLTSYPLTSLSLLLVALLYLTSRVSRWLPRPWSVRRPLLALDQAVARDAVRQHLRQPRGSR